MSTIEVLFFSMELAVLVALPLNSSGEFPKKNLVTDDDNADIIDLSLFGKDLYGTSDLQLGALLMSNDTGIDDVNPEELGSYLEGDILVPYSSVAMRTSRPSRSYHWPNGVVPYKITGPFTDDEDDLIYNVLEQFHQDTCIRFVPRNQEIDYIVISNNPSGCWSAVGRMRGRQFVNLQTPACLHRVGTVIHELMHALGVVHEHNREDRDEFVRINWKNIREKYSKNFKKEKRTTSYGMDYDYGSVMHYSQKAYSQNGQRTLEPLRNPGYGITIGQRHGLSESDVEKLNWMYHCP